MLLPFGKLNLGFRKCIYYISVVNLINAVIKGRKKQLLRSLKCRLKALIISAYTSFTFEKKNIYHDLVIMKQLLRFLNG